MRSVVCSTWGKMASGTWISESLRALASDLEVYVDGRMLNKDIAESYKWRLEMSFREMLAMELCGELNEADLKALGDVAEAFALVCNVVEKGGRSNGVYFTSVQFFIGKCWSSQI